MVSHNDIVVELDQGLNFKNRGHSDSLIIENGNALKYIRRKEKEVKLFKNNEDEISQLDHSPNYQAQSNINKKWSKMDSMKSVNDEQLKMLEAEVMIENKLRFLEVKMKDSGRIFYSSIFSNRRLW